MISTCFTNGVPLSVLFSEFLQKLSASVQANASLPLTVIDVSENAIEDRGKSKDYEI